jgi:hypothetical protein
VFLWRTPSRRGSDPERVTAGHHAERFTVGGGAGFAYASAVSARPYVGSSPEPVPYTHQALSDQPRAHSKIGYWYDRAAARGQRDCGLHFATSGLYTEDSLERNSSDISFQGNLGLQVDRLSAKE